MAACPQQSVATLQMLGADERQLLLQTWNATAAPYPTHQCIHQLFEAQVARSPEATALVYEAQTLSYAQLNARANRLAHRLIELGVKPDTRVVLCVERSPAMVVGLLAILKAGGAYVPLDPAYSSERLTHILADTAPTIVLADAAGRAALGDAVLTSCTVIDPNRLPEAADTNPSVSGLTAHDLAYVIYTSGSTGTPKGVMVEHAQVVRLFDATHSWYGFNERDIWCLFHSFAFDFSVWELWGALRYGGKLVIVPHHTARSAQAFHQLVCEQGITVLNQTPSAFKAFIASQAQSALSDQLRYVIFGGEALEPAILQAWYATHDERRPQLVNMYGITETTVHVTYRPLRQQDSKQAGNPIGVRIPDLKIYLLDAHGQPVPLGAVGELYIGGGGVARGYLNRPELTAERFVRDPFSDAPDARMYKTGDLARYLSDGNLAYVGRNDDQIKMRGFRIEPGEIEACLAAHPQVRDVVVLVRGEGLDKRLIAYVVAEPDDALASMLRTYVATRLPEYMVPAAFVRLDALPLTPNGKLDRRALPEPDADALAHQAYEAPQGELETTLASIWSELLGVERVGRHDSFFALGGHSLLAVRLMNRVGALGADVPLAALFASPTLAAFAAGVKAQLNQQTSTLPEITPVSREGALPLSFAQQRLWFLAQLDEVRGTYHIPLVLRVRGPFDRAAWQQALDALFARHEALRSTFVSVDGQPQVRLLPADTGMPLRWHDLRGVPDADAQRVRLTADEVHAPFDLARGPLMRACVVQLADDDYQCVLTQHHIVSDGWSIDVLVRELSALYAASVGAQADPLPPLAVQYPDYATWQRQWLSGERLQTQSDYWRTTLADAPVLLELPTDRPRPVQQSFAGAHVPVRIDVQTTCALKRLSAEHGTTLFMTVLAAWSAVLARLSGQDDLVIGTPSANRGHRAIEPLIGFFVNTLALRVNLEDEPTTAQLLERVRRTTLDAQAHQDLPFEQVVEVVQPPRRLNHTPLFQVLFAWQSNETGQWRLPGLDVTPDELDYDIARFDLELHLYEAGEEITGSLHYASALFDPATIERHVGYLTTMLQAMVARPQQPVATLQMLGADERQWLLQAWNTTAAPDPAHPCIHQLFEAQVARSPDATALVYEAQTLSYAQLNARANRLAHRLIELGVKPDARVAICVERSPAMVVGLLAILKAGGAYVPLDPAYPPERLAHILADTAPAIVLADAAGQSALGDTVLASFTVLDPNVLPERATTNPQVPGLSARHLAYVIYTSGSTGIPKGVMVEHAQIAHLFDVTQLDDAQKKDQASMSHPVWMRQAYGLTPDDRVLQKAPLTFDVSVWECFCTLLNGATLVVAAPGVHRDPSALVELMIRQRITTVHFVPSMLSMFLATDAVQRCTAVKRVLCTGEALTSAQVRLCQRLLPHAQLHNLYGPTEATIGVAAWTCPAEYTEDTIPIGRPIAHNRLYLLDRHGQPVPLGATGELYISGASVVRGYLNGPDLTAERFLLDPFSDREDARMYKTGDLARYRPDGNLAFLGRNDHQVKIRGLRIELGEIKTCLVRHPQVQEAVVLALGEGMDKRLVAYVVAEPDDALASELRAHVAARLPEYMVPAAFVRLDVLPLTPNGKLDRRALPEPDADALAHHAYEAPQGELETTLATIWTELLGVERVSRHDSFFALGGHSLLVVRLMNRVGALLGADVPLTALFASPTLAAFAAVVSAQLNQPVNALPEITPISREGALPLSFAQQRLWFLAQLDGVSGTYHIPLVLRVRGPFDRAAWKQALDALFARHEALRSTFVSVDGQPQVQLLPADTGVPLHGHDLRGVPDADAQLSCLTADEARAPFDLTRGPLMRACVIQLADDEHVLVLTQHHIVSDGWSFGVLVRELSALYAASVGAQADPLPALTIQYPDYAAWQRQWLCGERLQTQSDYWRTTLADAPVLLELPTDRPRPVQQSFAGAHVPVQIDARTTQALKRLSAEHGTTLFMTVLAAWSAVLARLSGQDDLVIGTPSANRGHAAIEPLIGFFVNTLALRVNLEGEPTTAQLLERVRRTTLDAQAHQDLPFEQVVEIVQPMRRLNHTPLFQVMFAWQSRETGQWRLPGLKVTPDELKYDIARFDLELHLYEAGEEILGSLHYASALFDPATIERHVGYLTTMLQAMAACPQQPVATLQMLGADERQLLLQTWNATAAPYPVHQCIHQLFEAQVARSPDATALVYEAQTLSYAQLNARANRLAHRLIELGVKPDARVAICVERSPAMVVGLLAILKAGGAYVPLDPAYPSERLAHILADAAPMIVLADAAGCTVLGEVALASCTVIDPNELPSLADTNPSISGLTARDLAYVIYTSGSTGKPKGVMIEHRNVVNFLVSMSSYPGMSSHDRLLAVTSISFDIAGLELYLPMSHGAAVVIASRREVTDPSILQKLIDEQKISLMQATPATWQVLLEQSKHMPGLTALCGGEALPSSLSIKLRDATQVTWNLYGPTETTIWSSIYCIAEHQDTVGPTTPIGRPIANTQIYLLDTYGQPVPLGAVGELYIGGAGVARGYLNRPELTAERFVPNPFSDTPDARMYKTGDLARYQNSGNLNFVNRADHQVKIRGYRIEPGEVEAVLQRHPAVAQAAVIAREDRFGDKNLVGYVVLRNISTESDPAAETHQVNEWQSVYDAYYSNEQDYPFGEDFSVWKSSYDGQPIPLSAMQAWRTDAVERIRALQPRRVLEIGVGTGLLLAHLAPHCDAYWGTDFSAPSIETLRAQLAHQPELASHVQLRTQAAHITEGLPSEYFDTIVINSVVQYFPSASYLMEVVRQAMDLLVPGGRVFIGDVRNLNLLNCFTTAVQLHQADSATDDRSSVGRRIQQALLAEKELLLAPAFFSALPDSIDTIAAVDIELKRGDYDNELSRYRYDVVLRKGPVNTLSLAHAPQLRWGRGIVEIEALQTLLATERPAQLRITGVPNARLALEIEAMQALEHSDDIGLIQRQFMTGNAQAIGLEPEVFSALGELLGYWVGITWSEHDAHACLDVVFVQASEMAQAMPTDVYLRPSDVAQASPFSYANQPASFDSFADVRHYVATQLPDYMVPAAFVRLDALPLTPNGKLDRRALPEPDADALAHQAYEAPQGELEATLATIWAQLLGIERVGRHDSFFALGGHSLLAVRLMNRVRALGAEMPLTSLFASPTLAAFAAVVSAQMNQQGTVLPEITPISREGSLPLSFAQQRLWFLAQLDEASANYHIPLVLRARGLFDRAAWQQALDALFARHEVLRSTFVSVEGQPQVQLLPVNRGVPLRWHDLRGVSDADAQLSRLTADEARTPFDLACGPLMRACVIQLADDEHVLMLTKHHIVSDGWSFGVLVRELSALYAASVGAQADSLPPLAIQYLDYAAWQRQWLSGERLQTQSDYWRRTLADAPVLLELPTDRPRPAQQSFAGAHVPVQI
ncbi:amino acid adenylation domain-containing protein, partial [Mycetohabitans sp. B3]|nr:amino acid adenylation domain-containing protein [Mycetohabitans sp. B3]